MKACPLRPITCDSEFCSAGAGAALGLRCGFLLKSGHLSRGPARKERLGFQPRLRAACSTDPRVAVLMTNQSSGRVSGELTGREGGWWKEPEHGGSTPAPRPAPAPLQLPVRNSVACVTRAGLDTV